MRSLPQSSRIRHLEEFYALVEQEGALEA